MDYMNITNTLQEQLIVFAAGEEYKEAAQALADHLQVKFTMAQEQAYAMPLALRLGDKGLTLTDGNQEMRGDLTKMLPRIKKGRVESELLVKASRIRGAQGPLLAIDATAGMGEDSILLAAAGFTVHMYERDPVIAALLGDAVRRAREIPELSAIAGRMHLFEEDSVAALQKMGEPELPDVVVLDPMFPERQKSALVKKKFQLIHQLEKPCDAEEELLAAAIAAHPRKIVIKRPVKGPNLAGRKPDYTISGKAVRYDCISIAR